MLYEQMDEDADSFEAFNSTLMLFDDSKKMPKQISRLLIRNFGKYKSNKLYRGRDNDSDSSI